jgi:hypothetical protein
MIIRQRKLRISDMHTQEKMVTINKKYEKREAAREKGAEKAAQVERAIEKEIEESCPSGTQIRNIFSFVLFSFFWLSCFVC